LHALSWLAQIALAGCRVANVMPYFGPESGRLVPEKKGLSHFIGSGKALADPAAHEPLGPGEKFWLKDGVAGYTAQAKRSAPGMTPRGPLGQAGTAHFEKRQLNGLFMDAPGGAAHAHGPSKSGAALISQWVDQELVAQGKNGPVPLQDRVCIFNEAFSRVMDMLPDYRPLFLSIQRENDALRTCLQDQLQAAANLEGRMKTMKMESLSFVGESASKFQEEVASLRQRLATAEAERDTLRNEKDALDAELADVKEKWDRDRTAARDSHTQNLDILSNLERMEKQVDMSRKHERALEVEMANLKKQVKDKGLRIDTVEGQLNAERDKTANMVPKEEHEALKEEIKATKLRCQELADKYASKQKDYLNMVETYSRSTGQTNLNEEVRPLTPRPSWVHCKGVIDPDSLRSLEVADSVQELLVQVMSSSRTLLAGYGLLQSAQKSTVFSKFARSPTTMPLADEASSPGEQRQTTPKGTEEAGEASPARRNSLRAADLLQPEKSQNLWKDEDQAMLPPDVDQNTPSILRHAEACKNYHFSRKKTADFLEKIMAQRGSEGDQSLRRPFLDYMMDNLPEDPNKEKEEEDVDDSSIFAINIFAAVRRYAAEPDFLAYLLLMSGRISDSIVKDNRSLIGEIVRIFRTHFDIGDGSTKITKEKCVYGIREVLPHKKKEHCQDLLPCFPQGGGNVVINYEWLLQDSRYVLSPIVYALRLQHLEESLSLCDRMERAVKTATKDGTSIVRQDALEAACQEDPDLSVLQQEDFARAFEIMVDDLMPESEQEAASVLQLMKLGGIFRELFFPALPDDDGEDGEAADGEEGDDAMAGDIA